MRKITVFLFSLLLLINCLFVITQKAEATTTTTFSYTGAQQTWDWPAGITSLTFDVQAAGGADANSNGAGGSGARVQGTLTKGAESTLYIYVGGSNLSYPTGGYNGGGNGSGSSGGGGGGRSDVRQGGTTEAYVQVAAGGGGGACASGTGSANGGNGGQNGSNGVAQGTSGSLGFGAVGGSGGAGGTGGTSGGNSGAGTGGAASVNWSGGGGGGYAGGGAGGGVFSSGCGGGGGGSSYAGANTSGVTYTSGYTAQKTNGSIILTYTPVVPTITTPTKASIIATGATLGGNVTSGGGATITSRGVCVGASANPAVGGNCFNESGAIGGTARYSHTSVLYNGKIYSWGGAVGGNPVNTMDIYDIANNSWSTGTSGGTGRHQQTSVLYNGKIYSWGGFDIGGSKLNTMDIYDIAGNSWTTGNAGGTARAYHTSVLYNGKIYSWGGGGISGALNTMDIYDIAGNSWSTGATGGTARFKHTSVLYNGKIYSWGGDTGGNPINTMDIYDIAGNSWTTGNAGGTARAWHTSVLYNGKIYSWGGSPDQSTTINTVDIYDITGNSWSTGAAGGMARFRHTSVINNTKMYSWGGQTGNAGPAIGTLEVYDVVGNSWANGTTGVFTVGATGLTQATIYHYRAYATNSVGTSYTTDDTFTTGTPAAPTVTLSAVTNVDSISTTLNGTVNPNFAATSAWYFWGTSNVACSSLPNATTSQSLGSGGSSLALTAALTGFVPGATYYYCAAAINSVGVTYSAVTSFTQGTSSGCTSVPLTSDYTASSSCVFGNSTADGVDRGTGTQNDGVLKVAKGTTLTIGASQVVAYGLIYKPGATVVRLSGGSLRRGAIWVPDTDGDGYPDNPGTQGQIVSATTPSGYARRAVIATANVDCAPNDNTKFKNYVSYTDSDGDNYAASVTAQLTCSGNSLGAGLTATSLGLDCNDTNASYNTTCPPYNIARTSPSSITATSAVMNTTINPNNTATSITYRYQTGATVFCNSSTPTSTLAGPTGLTGTTDLSGATTQQSLSGLTGNTTYYFCATANNSYGSVYSLVGTFLTSPSAPTGGAAGSATTTSLSVSWTAPTGGAASYNLVWCSGASCTPSTVITGVTSAYSHTGLSANTTYGYLVRSVNASGTSDSSTFYGTTMPNAPTGGAATTVSPTVLSVSWTAPTGGAASYNLVWCSGASCTPSTVITGVTSAYSHTGRTCNTTYGYLVRSVNASGTADSSTFYGTTSACAPSAFVYTGAQQTWVVPTGVTSVTVDAMGAAGGYSDVSPFNTGLGGRLQGTLAVTPGETLYIYVGGSGTGQGGWNGGGPYGTSSNYGSYGGGASDIRRTSNGLGNRIFVAGGGGGGGSTGTYPGYLGGGGGGSTTGATGAASGATGAGGGGVGGSQGGGGAAGAYGNAYAAPTAGSLGQGGTGGSGYNTTGGGGGGGGGYYGGGGGGAGNYVYGTVAGGGGGGGSSYYGSLTGVTDTQNYRAGGGQITISY